MENLAASNVIWLSYSTIEYNFGVYFIFNLFQGIMLILVLKFWNQVIKGVFDKINEKWTELQFTHKLDTMDVSSKCLVNLNVSYLHFCRANKWVKTFSVNISLRHL